MFVDSHCHLEMEEYDKDREAVIERGLKDNLSYMVTVGTEVRYFPKVIEIVEANPAAYGVVGVHPHNASDYSQAVEDKIKEYLKHPKIIGYGEIGLDFYRDYSPRDVQVKVFKRQIEVGREAALPIVIHSRNAKEETLKVMKDMGLGTHPTVIHCYSYDLETAKTLLGMGMYLSVPGTITYKNPKLAQVVRYAPLDRLLSETDAPFLTPVPHRGKRNEPAFVTLVVREIARIKEKSIEEVAEALLATFKSVFINNTKGIR